jgi:hypothetical protein
VQTRHALQVQHLGKFLRSGFRVSAFAGSGIQVSAFDLYDSEFMVSGIGFRTPGFGGGWLQGFGCKIWGLEFRV